MLEHQKVKIDKTKIADMDEQLKTILDLIIDLTNIQIEHEREEINKLRKSGDIIAQLLNNKKNSKYKRQKLPPLVKSSFW